MLRSFAHLNIARHLSLLSARMSTKSQTLVFAETGNPLGVLSLKDAPIPAGSDLKPGQILVKILAAPINPSDINTVEGKYPLRPELPGVPGNEAVAKVEAVGPEVSGIEAGDHVVPVKSCEGTWRTHAVVDASAWHKIPSSLPLEVACAMSINPPTALLMLKNFVNLQPGDVVIQNGANSAVGKYVIQLAKDQGLKTVNVIRARHTEGETQALKEELHKLGATLVTTAETLKTDLKESGLPAPKLALDCVGGETATAVAKTLEHGGTMVTYGAMSKKPLTIAPSLLIFKDLKFKGFWVSGSYTRNPNGKDEKGKIVDDIVDLYQRGILEHAPVTKVSIDNWKDALTSLEKGQLNSKLVFWSE